MRTFRDIKREGRRILHDHMKLPALLLSDKNDAVGIPVTVRLHTKFAALGDQKGTSLNSAELEAMIPKAILMLDQLPSIPERNSIISVAVGEAYRIDHTEEPDDISITAHIVQLELPKTVGLPVPENG